MITNTIKLITCYNLNLSNLPIIINLITNPLEKHTDRDFDIFLMETTLTLLGSNLITALRFTLFRGVI